MNKRTIQILSLLLICIGINSSCNKTTSPKPQDPVSKTITLTDIAKQYFVFQKNVGKPLVAIYFVEEAGTLKFFYDARGARRVGVPTLSDVSPDGTATLNIDVDGDGASVIKYKLLKAGTGGLSLTSTTYQGTTGTVEDSKIYKVSDLGNFKFEGIMFNRVYSTGGINYHAKCEFSATMLNLRTWKTSAGTVASEIDAFNKPYYSLGSNVGAKVDDDLLIIAHSNFDGTFGYDIDDNGLLLHL